MKKSALLLLVLFFLSPANGSVPLIPFDEIETDKESTQVNIANTPQSEESTLKLEGDFYSSGNRGIVTFLIKGHDKIQASISNESKNRIFRSTLNQGSLRSVTEFASRSAKINEVGSDDRAEYLFDLLAVTPGYQFQDQGGFDRSNAILDGYRLELERDASTLDGTGISPPTFLKLYRIEADSETLVREAEYLEFYPLSGQFLQPKRIQIKEADSEDVTEIVIQNVEQDITLPNFLFE